MKRIAFLTDIHLDEQFPLDINTQPYHNFRTVLDDLEKRKITDVIFGGDIGEATAHPYFFKALQPFSHNLVLGNHDAFDIVKKSFRQQTAEEGFYYKKEDENYVYLFLDSSTGEMSKAQLHWLQAGLISNKKIIVTIHHPVLPVNTPADRAFPLKNRHEAARLLYQSGKEISVFCGHYHINDEQQSGNIHQFITPSLSYQLVKHANDIETDSSTFGYRIICIDKDRIETEVISFVNTNL